MQPVPPQTTILLSILEYCFLNFSLISLTKIAMALEIADELRTIFTQVPYKDIQEVINETR